ncbi:phosphoribosyltransferase family protein [Solwaraspora sp. WMMD406]|uniref:phosphoribosyltransferase n=1 Tax=Solwaraspora sp. WMMD406 TaxID=3016095 RepID=UPI0024174222|nr:phosphoribosyltransferase family protein [Solwaraspora sp. WMMD406]MDG4763087.1 phosphoribosyltransferase family protein [Solwaraspora sp. WMMD406]
METVFQDRRDAAEALAEQLTTFAGRPDVTVLGLLRGGAPIAAVVARRLDVTFDVLVIRKLGLPSAPEVAFGAIGPGGVQVLNREIADQLDAGQRDRVVAAETAELLRREQLFRRGRPPLRLAGRTVVLVDDGLATGATARAAIAVSRGLGATRVVLAVPVGSAAAVADLAGEVDEMVCPVCSDDFRAVGQYYVDFHQVSDEEVAALPVGSR